MDSIHWTPLALLWLLEHLRCEKYFDKCARLRSGDSHILGISQAFLGRKEFPDQWWQTPRVPAPSLLPRSPPAELATQQYLQDFSELPHARGGISFFWNWYGLDWPPFRYYMRQGDPWPFEDKLCTEVFRWKPWHTWYFSLQRSAIDFGVN